MAGYVKVQGMSRYDKIWRVVRKIPYGKVATYGQVARVARMEGMARLVGYALHALPEAKKVPWHRVINAAGRISLVGPSARKQRAMLESEGIQFSSNGKINLREFGWEK
jgi:methylated-DNA-protein-cysteine methyltransferase-like protein